MPDSPSKVFGGVGTLYAAPLGTTEPTSVTGALPTGWTNLGFTDAGSVFEIAETWQDMVVEESYWAIRKVLVMMKGTLTFDLAETTAQNLALSLNLGYPYSSALSTAVGTHSDGSLWVEPPTPGEESRVMLAWDALTLGEAQPVGGQTAYGRLIVRQAVNTGGLKQTNKKGSQKRTWTCKFEVEQPTTTPSVGSQPVNFLFPQGLQS